MGLTTQIKRQLNRWLSPLNIQVESLTAERTELLRLRQLQRAGHFDKPVFPIPAQFRAIHPEAIFKALGQYRDRFQTFSDPRANAVGFDFNNEYFSSPDAEVLYTIIRENAPQSIVEIGSGNSTKIARQAIIDGNLSTRLISVDPQPRTEVDSLCNEVWRSRVEFLEDEGMFKRLSQGDILFVDSSHEITTGNDVVYIFLRLIPRLAPGVLVHVHDVFLPFEYPAEWIIDNRWKWTEQYLLQAIVNSSETFDVLWPGQYLQRTRSDFQSHFPVGKQGTASSFWLKKIK